MPTTDEIYTTDWITHASLQGKRVHLTIRNVTVEKAFDKNSFVLHFDETEKKFRLNKTNAKMLAMLTEEEDSDNWIGYRITLKPDITTFQGEPKKTVAIDSELPKQKERNKKADSPDPDDDDEIPF